MRTALRGGVLLPAVPPDVDWIKPLYAPDYDPLWAVCEQLDVVVNHHSGGGSPDYGPYPVAGVLWIAETTFFSRRALTHLLLGGVFERFPRLRFVVTEQGASWIPPLLAQLDGYHAQMKTGRIGELKYTPDQVLPLTERVLRPQLLGGRQLPQPGRGRVATRHRARPVHVGQRLPAQREHLPLHA